MFSGDFFSNRLLPGLQGHFSKLSGVVFPVSGDLREYRYRMCAVLENSLKPVQAKGPVSTE